MRYRLESWLLLAAIGGLYIWSGASGAVLDDGDALYAGVAQQMIERDDWVTPYVNGVRFLDKPPLMYWLMACSFRVFGFTELAARLPMILAVVGTSLLIFLLARAAAGDFAGNAGALAVSLAPGTFLFTRMVFPDMLFVFMLTLALYGFFVWYARGGQGVWPALLSYAAASGAVMSKGLIGVIFPAATVFTFLLLRHRFSWVLRFHMGKGIALFLLLALPWHLVAGTRNPGFFWSYFVNEHLLRFLGRRQPLDYESIPLLAFWGLLLVWLFPWAAFLPAAARFTRKNGAETSSARELTWLSLSWVIVVFVFFSVSSRIEHYSLPIFPPLALMIGIALANSGDPAVDRRVNRGIRVLGAIGALLLVLLIAGLGFVGVHQEMSRGAAPHTHAYNYYFAPIFDLPASIRLRLRPPLVAASAGLSVGMLAAWWLNRRASRRAAVMALGAAMMVFCVSASYSLHVCEDMLSSKQFAAALNASWTPSDRLVIVGDYETANSLNFYSRTYIQVYGGRAAVLERGLTYPDAPHMILSGGDLHECWAGKDRVFLLAPDRELARLDLGQYFRLQSSTGRTLVCNKRAPRIDAP